MALRPLRECRKAGCYELTREANGYCQEHQGLAFRRNNYNEFDKFYWSSKWKSKRLEILKRDNGTCVMCLMIKGNPEPATDVHHIKELITNFDKRLTSSNLICLCSKCHSEVHREYDKGEKKKEEMQNFLQKILIEKKKLL